jgi:hypothetical protein
MATNGETNSCIKKNTPIQKSANKATEWILEKYRDYLLNPDFRNYMKNHEKIFSPISHTPEIIKNKIFNKNKCFIDADENRNNFFPTFKYKIKSEGLKSKTQINTNKRKKIIDIEKEDKPQINKFLDSNDILKLFFNINHEDIKIMEFIKGGLHDDVDNKKNEEIINMIKSNGSWVITINKKLHYFNNYEIFRYLTENILEKNQKLDECKIYHCDSDGDSLCPIEGGYLYICLKLYLPLLLFHQNNNNDNADNVYNSNKCYQSNNSNINSINFNKNNQFNQYNQYFQINQENICFQENQIYESNYLLQSLIYNNENGDYSNFGVNN